MRETQLEELGISAQFSGVFCLRVFLQVEALGLAAQVPHAICPRETCGKWVMLLPLPAFLPSLYLGRRKTAEPTPATWDTHKLPGVAPVTLGARQKEKLGSLGLLDHRMQGADVILLAGSGRSRSPMSPGGWKSGEGSAGPGWQEMFACRERTQLRGPGKDSAGALGVSWEGFRSSGGFACIRSTLPLLRFAMY